MNKSNFPNPVPGVESAYEFALVDWLARFALAVSMPSEAPLTLISPLRAGRGEVERTRLGSLFGDLDTVPPKSSPLPLEKGEGQGEGSSWLHWIRPG